MNNLLLYSITPISGFVKNYVKYKQVNFMIFARTPVLYLLIDKILRYYKVNNIIMWTLILERWFFFYYKILIAYLYDHYHKRKQKYIQKYNLRYPVD
jgi:hypothetical protein